MPKNWNTTGRDRGVHIGGLSAGTGLLGRTVRLLQTGNIQSYAFLFGLGVTVIIYYVVVR